MMSYLNFDPSTLTNLEESLEREFLMTNARGAYAFSTILGCNTRKYHGLLVVPSPDTLENRWLLLSSLDDTVVQHGAEFNLSVHRYSDGTISPNGHKYLRSLDVTTIYERIYRVGGVLISKAMLFCEERNQLLIRYRLLETSSATTLRIKPLLGFRKVKELTHENSAVQWDYREEEQGVSWSLYAGMPRLYMQGSHEMRYQHAPHWNRQLFYQKEADRGHECIEDLPVPGIFEVDLVKGEDFILSVSDSAIDPTHLLADFDRNSATLTPRDSFRNTLKRAMEQFYYTPDDDHGYLVAGFPWFRVRHRDQMIALTAASYGIEHPERYHAVMKSTLQALWNYYDAEESARKLDPIIYGIEQPDALLWLVNCIQDYSRWVGMEETRQEYGAVVEKAIGYLRKNRHPELVLRDNALLYATPQKLSKPITWMDETIDGYPVVDRRGYIVEYNALWYNALCFYRALFEKKERSLDDLIDRVGESFVRVFVNEYDYLFDYVAEDKERDWNVRPSQLLAVGLTYSPLSRKLQRSVLDIVTKELLTPKGIRSLSPKSGYYRGYCYGHLTDRYYAYMQGGVWSWLIYFYLSGYLKLFQRTGISFVDRLLIPFESELSEHGIGTISEVYDGTPPYTARSGISLMTSTSAILRIQNRLDEFLAYDSDDIFDLRLSLTDHHLVPMGAGDKSKSKPEKEQATATPTKRAAEQGKASKRGSNTSTRARKGEEKKR